LKLSNPSKVVISKNWKSRILEHNAWGLFFRWFVASKAHALGAAENAADPVRKNARGRG